MELIPACPQIRGQPCTPTPTHLSLTQRLFSWLINPDMPDMETMKIGQFFNILSPIIAFAGQSKAL